MLILRAEPGLATPSVAAARALLEPRPQKDATLAVLGAAALCAVCAVALAGTVVLGPPGPGSPPVVAPSIRSAL